MQCGRYTLDFSRPRVMGILNLTPDSFSDGGHFNQLDTALRHAENMLAEGADLIDLGGESTRPQAQEINPNIEIDRVMPVLERLQGCGVPLSIDTRHTSVMRAALSIGVDFINDVCALEDEGAIDLVAPTSVGICLMHKQGKSAFMQDKPHYKNVVTEVIHYLQQRLALCAAAKISRQRLMIDPGFGFGKTLSHNMQLLAALPDIALQTNQPLLLGLSRKSMLGQLTGEPTPSLRLGASIAAALKAVDLGARIVRVHDVKPTVQALRIWHHFTAEA